MMSHFSDSTVVNANIFKIHWNINGFEELVSRINRLICNIKFVLIWIVSKNIDAVFHKAIYSLFAKNVFHPSWCICRIEEGYLRIIVRINIANLVVGFTSGNYSAWSIFAARCCKSDDINYRNRIRCKCFILD